MTKKNDFVVGERYLVRINTEQVPDFAHKVIREVVIDEFSPNRQYVKLTLYEGIKKFKRFKKERVKRIDTWMWVDINEIEKIEKLDKKGRMEE